MRARSGLTLAFALTGILAAPLPIGAAAPAQAHSEAAQSILSERQGIEQRLQDIGWRLAAANASYCSDARPSIGLMLHDMASYADPATVRRLLGLQRDFAVLAVAAGSPAAKAGLAAQDEIAGIDGIDPNGWPAAGAKDWRRAVRVHDLIDERLADRGEIKLTLASGRLVTLLPEQACPTRFELGGPGKRALADGARVVIERDFPGLSYSEDELAAAIAHELAHNLLDHRKWLDAQGRKQAQIRLTEREADRLMPWLLANAGYDPGAATRFMARWGPSYSGGLFRKRSHDGWDERRAVIDAEVSLVREAWSTSGAADWSRGFRREFPTPR